MPSETLNLNPRKYIEHLLSGAAGEMRAEGGSLTLPPVEISVPEPRFGDFSTNLAMRLAKILKQNPATIGQNLITRLKELDAENYFEKIEFFGGFINFTLSHSYLLSNLSTVLEQGDLYGSSLAGEGKVVLVEYFQNNVAKPPHVGHLRSAVIGDCLLRIFKSQGYKTISDSHIGDWGTQFGILLYGYKKFIEGGGKKEDIERDPINELNKLYVAMSAQIEADESLRERGKEEFAELERGSTENRELWQWFVRVSLEDFEKYRHLLGILPFDHSLGESFYEDKMPEVLKELKAGGLLVESQGAQIVDLEDAGLGVAVLVKSDGASTYLLRDLATIKYRTQKMDLSKVLYVVDNRQSHHFRQTFEICRRIGYLDNSHEFEHVDFGFMSLPEGPISTRKGTTISLRNLIEEATKRALLIIEEKNPELEHKHAIAQQVALAAIKYFDLSHNRKTEIVFTWEKALSFEGNTGPYLQYTYARIHGILRKMNNKEGPGKVDDRLPLLLPELLILRKLIQFPGVVSGVTHDCLPNTLCNYLFELSQAFNSFYQEVPVLREKEESLRNFRLRLITATAQVISNGLYLLGIEAPEEMYGI